MPSQNSEPSGILARNLFTDKPVSPRTGKLSSSRSGSGNDPLPFAQAVTDRHLVTTSLPHRGGRVHRLPGLSGFSGISHGTGQLQAMRVVVEEVPWVTGKHGSTKVHMHFLGHWARKLSWKETAESFGLPGIRSWRIWSSGLEHRVLGTIPPLVWTRFNAAKGTNI